ncbi:MAG TPA: hypothetical protein VF516_27565 [Kofleriaceae bacterium]
MPALDLQMVSSTSAKATGARSWASASTFCVPVMLVAACFQPSYHHPTCGPREECPSGLMCIEHVVCGEPDSQPGTWGFASAADFTAPGYAMASMTIEPSGLLTPTAYTYGGLMAHGLPGMKLWSHGDTSWTKLDAVTAAGAGLWRGESFTTTSVLSYLGITDDKQAAPATLWFEGEVWLDAGSAEQFELTANDIAFVELARPGTSDYVPLTESSAAVPVTAPDTGWYPIRIGVASADRSMLSFAFLHGEGSAPLVPWTRDRMRARASEVSGALRLVFANQVLGGGQDTPAPIGHIEDGDLLPFTTFPVAPQGASGVTNWSARYIGQVYADQPGSYTLTVSSDDGNRARLGSASAQTSWGFNAGNSAAVTTVPVTLNVGWNDLAIDYNQLTGGALLQATIDGPDLVEVPVPRDRLRPVESADDRLAFGGDDAQYMIPLGGGSSQPATATMSVAAYAGEVVTSIDVAYVVTENSPLIANADLETGNTRLNLGVAGRILTGTDDLLFQVTVPPGAGPLAQLLGGPAGGIWKLHVYDDRLGDKGIPSVLKSARLTLHTTGGPERIARTASWTSPLLALPSDVLLVSNVMWDARLPQGATVSVQARSCAQPDCSHAAWLPVTPSAATALPPAPFLQLRLELTSDGVVEPELRSLSVSYVRTPG